MAKLDGLTRVGILLVETLRRFMAMPNGRVLTYSALVLSAASLIPSSIRAQCVTAPSTCTEYVSVGEGPRQVLVYRSHPLTTANPDITRALVIVHGAERSSASFEFRSALAGAFLVGALDYTVIIAPRFKANDVVNCTDSLATNELNWECDVLRVDWRLGGVARNDSAMSSFDAIDAILRRVARKSEFPNLRTVVLAGHSAGGQFVTLYAMANQVHEGLGAELNYVVANAAGYAYMDDRRPTAAWLARSNAIDRGDTTRVPFAAYAGTRECSDYGDWPFGLVKRPPYAARLTEAELREQAARRPVTYLLSELDVAQPGGFYGSCAAMAQGSSRLSRGVAFASYMTQFNQGPHRRIIVDGCGHDVRCVYTSGAALSSLFRRQ